MRSLGLDSTVVNIRNTILLKQTPQRAVINNKEEDEPEDPEQDGELSCPVTNCQRLRKTLSGVTQYYRNCYPTHPPGQYRRKWRE